MARVERLYNEQAVAQRTDGSEGKRKRVAAYCRVSTDNEGQMSSLELQMAAFRTQIELRPDWELVDIYSDEGISGTRVEKRPEFQRMIRDCEAGKIDYIITKSISRFARNTLECLQHIRYLQSLGVQLLFEKENIDTGTAFSEMLLTILAAFAQEESRSLSENAKWGIRKRFEAGIPKRTYIFGYTYDEQGNYVIVPEQAETVRYIFDLYETGRYSMHQIAQKLMAEKRPSAYVNNWDASHVHCILTNEKYVGDLLMQKKYTVDHLTHREVKNRDHVLPSYYVRDHHTPIVSRKQYDRVHRIAELKSTHKRPVQYPYGDLLVCPVCGERLMQHKMDVQDTHAAWHCDRNESSCGQYVLKPKLLDAAMLEAYQLVDVEQVKQKQSEAAQIMVAMKQKHPSFKTVEYFWLDDLVEKITFGRNHAMTVHWKYGGKTDVTLQIANMKDDPVYVAGLSRRKRERAEAQNALLEKASDLMTSDMPQEEVMAALAREAKKYARRAAAF